MKRFSPLLCLTLMLASLPPAVCQDRSSYVRDRSGGVRMRVRDERGNQQAEETAVYSDSYALLIATPRTTTQRGPTCPRRRKTSRPLGKYLRSITASRSRS
jgi:hypothetical protein